MDEASIEEALKRIARANGYYDVILEEIVLSNGINNVLASSPSIWQPLFVMYNPSEVNDPSLINNFTAVVSQFSNANINVTFGSSGLLPDRLLPDRKYFNFIVKEKSWSKVKSRLEEVSQDGCFTEVFGFKEPLMMPYETFEEALIRHDLHT
jgi:hypothetical protein